jgi:hypothetical protein
MAGDDQPAALIFNLSAFPLDGARSRAIAWRVTGDGGAPPLRRDPGPGLRLSADRSGSCSCSGRRAQRHLAGRRRFHPQRAARGRRAEPGRGSARRALVGT